MPAIGFHSELGVEWNLFNWFEKTGGDYNNAIIQFLLSVFGYNGKVSNSNLSILLPCGGHIYEI